MNSQRLGSVAGVAFAVLFAVSLFMVSSIPVGGGASTDQEIRDFYGDSGDRLIVIIGVYLALLSVILFLLFLAGLYRGWGGADEEVTRTFSLAALLSGVAFSVAYMVGSGLLASLAGGISLGDEPSALPDTGVARFLGQAGYAVALVGGGGFAGAFVGAVSIVELRRARLPAWAGWVGVVVAVIVAAISVIFLPLLLFPLWIILIAILGWRDASRASV